MIITKIVERLRLALSDNNEPYVYDDKELKTILEIAVGAYSKYRPAKKKGTIKTIPGVSEYLLPDDFQTWITGLEDYTVYEKTVDLGFKPLQSYEIIYFYLADRKPTEVPTADVFLLVDYVFYFIVDGAIKETSDISALKLGKGLQIQFSNVDELNKAAERRLNNFNEKLQANKGGWT